MSDPSGSSASRRCGRRSTLEATTRTAVDREVGAELRGQRRGSFERACVYDSDRPLGPRRAALSGGAGARLTVTQAPCCHQLASSLRNVGHADESVALLRDELEADHDERWTTRCAFLALALADVGLEREAVSQALTALAPHLPRYQRSLASYAGDLVGD
jgi:hypothetical protein